MAVEALAAAAGRSLLATTVTKAGEPGGPRAMHYCDLHHATYDKPVDDVRELMLLSPWKRRAHTQGGASERAGR